MAAKTPGRQTRQVEHGCSGGLITDPTTFNQRAGKSEYMCMHVCVCVLLYLCVLKGMDRVHLDKQLGLVPSFGFPHLTRGFPSPESSPVSGAGDAAGSDPVPALQELPGLASKQTTGMVGIAQRKAQSRVGKELSLHLEGFLAVAGTITEYISSVSPQQPCREDPTEASLLASQWGS